MNFFWKFKKWPKSFKSIKFFYFLFKNSILCMKLLICTNLVCSKFGNSFRNRIRFLNILNMFKNLVALLNIQNIHLENLIYSQYQYNKIEKCIKMRDINICLIIIYFNLTKSKWYLNVRNTKLYIKNNSRVFRNSFQ